MTALHERPSAEIPDSAHGSEHLIDLSRVALESPAESIAHENEVVEHIAHEHDYPERPSDHPIEEQLQGLVDPTKILHGDRGDAGDQPGVG